MVGTSSAEEHRGNERNNGHGDSHGDGHGSQECPYRSIATHGDMHMAGDHEEEEHDDPLNEYLLCPEHGHTEFPSGHTMHHVNAAMGGCPTGTGLENIDVDAEDPDIERINEVWPACTDWPAPTKELVESSRESLTQVYTDVGTPVARGYIPYFDVVTPGATGGVSHWSNPDYIQDNHYEPNPMRSDSIILDNEW